MKITSSKSKQSIVPQQGRHHGDGDHNKNRTTRQTITKLGCINSGEISCVVLVGDKSLKLLRAGQEPRIRLAYRNDSTTPVKAVALKLRQKSHYYTNKPYVNKEKEASRFEVSRTMLSTRTSSIGKSYRMSDTFIMPPLPKRTVNTFEGDNHYVRHELQVTLITGLGHSNVTMKVPVTVVGGLRG